MEDGTIRYTYAEVITIPYARSFSDPSKWIPFTIDFIIHDPYWYEVNDGYTFLYQDIPLLDIICGCASMSEAQAINYTSIIGYDHTQCIQNCSYDGVIIRNTDIAIPSEAEEWAELGASHTANGETTIQTCVEGSAGATRPKISFRNAFTNPKLTNLENDCEISYNGGIANGEYLEIDLNSSLSGEIDDLTINTNIGGFDRNDLTINNNGFFDLEKAINNLKVEGGTAVNSTFTIKFKNKYHN